MIASRHLPALAVLLALACVPTVLHSYVGMTVSDRRSVAALPLQLDGLSGREKGRSVEWVMEEYGTNDFIEREFGPSLTLFVARSYDAKSLYHHPELGVAHGDGYERGNGRPAARAPRDSHFCPRERPPEASVYALLYDGKFIEHPVRFQLQNALTLLVRPRALMTLFFVRGPDQRPVGGRRAVFCGISPPGRDRQLSRAARFVITMSGTRAAVVPPDRKCDRHVTVVDRSRTWRRTTIWAAACITLLDAALLERKHGLFTGGFLASHQFGTTADSVAFLMLSALLNASIAAPLTVRPCSSAAGCGCVRRGATGCLLRGGPPARDRRFRHL